MSRLVLDAGAFIAFERGDALLRARLATARRMGIGLVTTSPVVAQVWRDGRRQANLSKLVAATDVHAPDASAAKVAGELLRQTGGRDVVDAFVVGVARHGDTILTSDPDDIRALITAAGMRANVLHV
jgi:hypothetical protein